MSDKWGRDELESMRKKGYEAYIKALSSPSNLGEITRLLICNGAARNILFKNFFNPSLFKTLRLMSGQ